MSMSRYNSVVVRPVTIRVDEIPTRNTDLNSGRRPLRCAVVTTCHSVNTIIAVGMC